MGHDRRLPPVGTHPRVLPTSLDAPAAWSFVEGWLSLPQCWIPSASEPTAAILARLMDRYRPTARLVPDAQLAALAIEYGVPLVSADTDFARFDEVRWVNPLRSG